MPKANIAYICDYSKLLNCGMDTGQQCSRLEMSRTISRLSHSLTPCLHRRTLRRSIRRTVCNTMALSGGLSAGQYHRVNTFFSGPMSICSGVRPWKLIMYDILRPNSGLYSGTSGGLSDGPSEVPSAGWSEFQGAWLGQGINCHVTVSIQALRNRI